MKPAILQIPEKSFSLPFLPLLVLYSPIPPLSLRLPHFSDNNAGEAAGGGRLLRFLQTCTEGRCVSVCHIPFSGSQCVCVLALYTCSRFHILPMYGCKHSGRRRSQLSLALPCTHSTHTPPSIVPTFSFTLSFAFTSLGQSLEILIREDQSRPYSSVCGSFFDVCL